MLEENVLVKAVGGEVEERCIALKRRLEKYGIPSSPSPTPSVTDSEVSSFVNTGRSTVRRNNPESPTRTMERLSGGTMSTTYGVDGEKSTSLEWRKMRPDLGEKGIESSGGRIPVPKKRNILLSPELENRKCVYMNEFCSTPVVDSEQIVNNRDNNTGISSLSSNKQDTSQQAVGVCAEYPNEKPFNLLQNTSPPDKNLKDVNESQEEEEHIYQSPVKTSQPKLRKKSFSSKSSQEGITSNDDLENPSKPKENLEKSFSSSVSSLFMAPSTISMEIEHNEFCKEPEYENVCKKENGGLKSVCASSGDGSNKFNGSNKDVTKNNCSNEKENHCDAAPLKTKSRHGSEDGDIEYERDVVVYEAITLGNDTIIYDKDNTHSSSCSNNSKKSDKSQKIVNSAGEMSVQDSVRHYENLAARENKKEWKITRGAEKTENKGIFNGFLNGLKKRGFKLEKKESKRKMPKSEAKNNKDKSCSTPDKEVETVIQGLEYSLKKSVSSDSLCSLGKQKENCIITNNFEDRASPEHSMHEIEIIPTRHPQIPIRVKKTFSYSSRSRTPDTVVYLESPSETSDTEVFYKQRKVSPTRCINMDSVSNRSGWSRGSVGIRRRDTFAVGSPDKNVFKQHQLKRSESVHVNRLEYNSHRSYSPQRRSSKELLVPMEESEIQISGRRFTQYTTPEINEVEHRNHVNNMLSSGMKRRRNRSCDDRLDRWLDEDCLRHSRYRYNYMEDYPPFSFENFSSELANNKQIKASHSRESRCRVSQKSQKSRNSSSEKCLNEYNSPVTGVRGGDYDPNFILNSSSNSYPLKDALLNITDLRKPTQVRNFQGDGRLAKKIVNDDPAIPTPDYSATPAGTLNNTGSLGGRHILDLASGLY